MTGKDYQKEFLAFAIETDVLRFGEFVLKSGRRSPYFFNAGLFNTGRSLARLGEFYADRLLDWGQRFDVLFGPAYKGITLAAATAVALSRKTGGAAPFCFNRKEAKDHGEGGVTVGAELRGRVVIVDDVVTAGISVDESVEIIKKCGAEPVAACIALDRRERGLDGGDTATELIERKHGFPVISIADLDVLVDFLRENTRYHAHLAAIENYRRKFGA